jgi:hypothetical protein
LKRGTGNWPVPLFFLKCKYMSEHLTHIAVYEDCARLVLNTEKFCEAFRSSVKNQYDSGLMTSGTRGNHIYAVPILANYKDRWNEVSGNRIAEQQIAGAIGWITHRAADLQMKPTWRAKTEADPDFPATEMQIYHDAVTVREVYSAGDLSTLSPLELITRHIFEQEMQTHPASRELNVAKVEELVTYLWQKELVELHSFHKKRGDVNKWLDEFVEYHQEFTEDLRIYIEAFQQPDPAKMDTYIYGINYYDRNDPLIRWVRGIQKKEDVSGIDLNKALEQAVNQSHYAQAVRKGTDFLLAASEYFEGRLEKDILYDTLKLGPNERE